MLRCWLLLQLRQLQRLDAVNEIAITLSATEGCLKFDHLDVNDIVLERVSNQKLRGEGPKTYVLPTRRIQDFHTCNLRVATFKYSGVPDIESVKADHLHRASKPDLTYVYHYRDKETSKQHSLTIIRIA